VGKFYQSIPKGIMGWKTETQDEVYTRENLYEYINGGAELYLTYDFQQVFVRRYVKTDAPEIVLEIYDMNTSKDAYGIFSVERQDEEVSIGQDSEYGGGLLRFWKDRFFVSILAIGDETTTKSAIFELGKKVAEQISATGQRPEILAYLPQENLVARRIRFFHTDMILNRQYFLANENILNLDRQTDCLFAPYQVGAYKSYLLMIDYKNPAKAKQAYQDFLTNYLPDAQATGFAKLENGKWTMAKLSDQLLLIVFEATGKEWAADLLSGVIKQMN